MQIQNYYTEAVSAGIITMLEKPEIVNRLLTIFIMNFENFDKDKLVIEVHHLREELEEYKDFDTSVYHTIRKLKVYYDGKQLMLAKILKDLNYNPSINTKVYSPVIGCPIGCKYCYSRDIANHFGLTECWEKPVFRGFYKTEKDNDGNEIPELFSVKSEKSIDWFLTYMSDFGCWKAEWQKNVFEQIITANDLKKKNNKPLDTFTLITKYPNGINLGFIPENTDLSNVILSCTVDNNGAVRRISDLIKRTKHLKITALVTYQPVLEHIEPKYLDELVGTFGSDNTWAVIGGWIGNSPDKVELEFDFIKDIIDKCIELKIPIKMEDDIKEIVLANGYDFLSQSPKCMIK